MNSEQTREAPTIGVKIRNIRHQRGISQQELLDNQYSEAYLSRVERDHLYPSEDFLAFLAERLGMSSEELLVETAPPKPKIRKAVREFQDAMLLDAHVALETKTPEAAISSLQKLDAAFLPEEKLPRYYQLLGQAEVEIREFESGLADLKRALALYETDPKTPAIDTERVRNWVGLAYYRQGKYRLAIEQHERCLQAVLQGRVTHDRFIMYLYQNLANEYGYIDKDDDAIDYYRKAADIAKETEEKEALGQIYWGMGMAYQRQKNLDRAKLYLSMSTNLYKDLEIWNEAGSVLGLLGLVMIDKKEFSEAETTLKEGLDVALKAHSSSSLSISYNNLAYLYYTQANYDTAEQNAEKSLKEARKIKDNSHIGQALAQLGEIRIAKGEVEAGIKAFDDAVTALERVDAAHYLQKICYRYADALEKLGKLAEAMKMYRKAYEYRDTPKAEQR